MVDLDLEESPACHYDYVELYDGTQVARVMRLWRL